jgi:hypothetical protein
LKYARKVDENQFEIVDALRLAGAKVWVISEPVDLLVGFRGKLMAMEVKNPKGRNTPTEQQVEFFEEFAGCPISYVDSAEAALRHLKILGNLVE